MIAELLGAVQQHPIAFLTVLVLLYLMATDEVLQVFTVIFILSIYIVLIQRPYRWARSKLTPS